MSMEIDDEAIWGIGPAFDGWGSADPIEDQQQQVDEEVVEIDYLTITRSVALSS